MTALARLGRFLEWDPQSLLLEALVAGPLTAKQAHSRVVKAGGNITYQGIHKALGEMVVDGVVARDSEGYRLDDKWLASVDSFLSKARLGEDAKPGVYAFDSVYAADEFMLRLFARLPVSGRPKLVLAWSHFWIPLFLELGKYEAAIGVMKKYRVHALSYADTPIDRWCADFWASKGVKHSLGSQNRFGEVISAQGVVLQAYYPAKFLHQLDLIYSRKLPNNLDRSELFDNSFEAASRVFVSVAMNNKLSERLQADVLSEL